MRPVDQTTFGVPKGNCFSACVASLLHLKIEQVPFFMDEDDWQAKLNRWLLPNGLYAVTFGLAGNTGWYPGGFHLIGGMSPRTPGAMHEVVAYQGIIVHDPNPSRAGLLSRSDITLLIPIDVGRGISFDRLGPGGQNRRT